MKNVLMVGAHYDDVDLGCGGTAARLVFEGKTVFKLTVTDNYVEESEFNKYTDKEASSADNEKACKILGIKNINDFDAIPNCNVEYSTAVMKKIEKIILEKNIDTVFMHSEYDMNHDHIKVAEICKVATRHVNNLFVYRSNIYITETNYNPRVFFDISEYIDYKRKALGVYGEEHQRSVAGGENKLFENAILQNKIWGYCINAKYAEGFEVIKEVR